jgi:hypothetical protein
MTTPSEVLVIKPLTLSSLASLYTKGLNPTPCTTPFIEIFKLSIDYVEAALFDNLIIYNKHLKNESHLLKRRVSNPPPALTILPENILRYVKI